MTHLQHEAAMIALTLVLIFAVLAVSFAAAPLLLRRARRTGRRIEQAVENVAEEIAEHFSTEATR